MPEEAAPLPRPSSATGVAATVAPFGELFGRSVADAGPFVKR